MFFFIYVFFYLCFFYLCFFSNTQLYRIAYIIYKYILYINTSNGYKY
jgi:hypothetical protein